MSISISTHEIATQSYQVVCIHTYTFGRRIYLCVHLSHQHEVLVQTREYSFISTFSSPITNTQEAVSLAPIRRVWMLNLKHSTYNGSIHVCNFFNALFHKLKAEVAKENVHKMSKLTKKLWK